MDKLPSGGAVWETMQIDNDWDKARRKLHSWDLYYLDLAKQVSTRSKDPSTKVGSCLVRPDFTLCSIGYNGFPSRMEDKPEWYSDREEKYDRIIHGEINALLNSRDEHVKGYTLYTVPFMPCNRCFVQMAQANVSRFVFPKATPEQEERWAPHFLKTRRYAQEMNISLVEIIV